MKTQHLTVSDLMIGDWMQFPHGIDKIVDMPYIEGRGLCASFAASATLFPVEIEKLQPISLTPKILEKNGFHYTNDHTLKGADTYVCRLDQRGFDYTITIKLNDYFAIDSYDDRVYRLVEISTGKWYVHHLQHALKLCGISKEIII